MFSRRKFPYTFLHPSQHNNNTHEIFTYETKTTTMMVKCHLNIFSEKRISSKNKQINLFHKSFSWFSQFSQFLRLPSLAKLRYSDTRPRDSSMYLYVKITYILRDKRLIEKILVFSWTIIRMKTAAACDHSLRNIS